MTIPAGDIYQQSSISAAYLPSSVGTTSMTTNDDGSVTITDHFSTNAAAGGVSQGITIARSIPTNRHVAAYGDVEKAITVTKNGSADGSYTVHENIQPTFNVSNITRTVPSAIGYPKIFVNQNYGYHFTFTTPWAKDLSDLSNIGTIDLNINVPAHFKANIDETKSALQSNGWSFTDVSQTSAGSPLVIKGLTNKSANSLLLTFYGEYEMAAPTADTPVTATASTATVNLYSGHTVTLTIPSWSDTIEGNETPIPTGYVFGGSVTNAYATSADGYAENTVPLTSNGDVKGNDGYLNDLSVTNETVINFKSVYFTATFSDGYSVDRLKLGNSNGVTQITVTYQDGTTATVTGTARLHNTEDFTVDASKNLAKVEWHGPMTAGGPAELVVYGKVATKNKSGQAMKVGDDLTASISVAPDPANPEFTNLSQNGWSATQEVVTRSVSPYTFGIQNVQTKTLAGSTEAGRFNFTLPSASNTGDLDDIQNPHFYIVLPVNVVANSASDYQDLTQNASVNNLFKVSVYCDSTSGRTIVEWDGSGHTLKASDIYSSVMQVFKSISYDLRSDVPTMSSLGYAYVSGDNLDVNTTVNPQVTASQLDMLKGANATHTYQVGSFTVNDEATYGTTISEIAQGNQDTDLVLSGSSDDKGSTAMYYSDTLTFNPATTGDTTLNNVVIIANLPTASDTSFKFDLDSNGVTLRNVIDGLPVSSSNYQVLYSTTSGNDSTTKTDLSNYVPDSQVTDWSKIQSIAVKINSIDKNAGGVKVLIKGTAPTLAEDAQKTGYLTGQAWADGLTPMAVANQSKQSSITISGTSTVKAEFRYTDDSGTVKYIQIPRMTHQYKDNEDSMYTADFRLQNRDLKLIPTGYQLVSKANVSQVRPTAVINGAKTWQTDAPNTEWTVPTSRVGSITAKYYMDGDTVVFDLEKASQKANLKFYDDTDGKYLGSGNAVANTGNSGDDISFTIPSTLDLSNYKFSRVTSGDLSSTTTVPGSTLASVQYGKYDNDSSTDQSFIAHFTHATEKIDQSNNPDNLTLTQDLTRTITYQFTDGTTHSEVTTPVTQTLHYTASGYKDKVTGKMVNVDNSGNIIADSEGKGTLTWVVDGGITDSGTLAKVVSPTVDGYSVQSVTDTTTGATDTSDQTDGNDVKQLTGIKHDHGNITVLC